MDRTKGFMNLNRFNSGRAIKKLGKVICDKRKDGRKKVKN